jgi:hypothetical protein
MISALLALGLHLTVVHPIGGRFEGPSLQTGRVPGANEQSSWRIVRRVIRRDKKGTESRLFSVAVAADGFWLPTESGTSSYSSPLLAPARRAATPSSQRDPPSRDPFL